MVGLKIHHTNCRFLPLVRYSVLFCFYTTLGYPSPNRTIFSSVFPFSSSPPMWSWSDAVKWYMTLACWHQHTNVPQYLHEDSDPCATIFFKTFASSLWSKHCLIPYNLIYQYHFILLRVPHSTNFLIHQTILTTQLFILYSRKLAFLFNMTMWVSAILFQHL